jgi:drug/metabolite transporter (DMT)-like permease
MPEPLAAATPAPAGAAAGAPPDASRGHGLLLAIGATVCWSLSGLLVRLIETASSWHVVLYRSAGVSAMLVALVALMHGRGAPRVVRLAGWPAVLAGACSAASSAFFILALGRVTVANALFVGGITPFLAALGGQAFLGERVPRAAWGAMALAATGVAVMLGGGLALGELTGNLLALGSAASFAAHALVLRSRRQADMLPAVLHAGLLGTLLGLLALALQGRSPAVTSRDLLLGLSMGAGQLGGGLVLYTRASRHLPAAELQLVATAELVLAPLWVWIGVGETPNAATLVGGALVTLAILAQALGPAARAPGR